MTTSQNFTLKIETSWAKEVVKFILETWNVNDVILMNLENVHDGVILMNL